MTDVTTNEEITIEARSAALEAKALAVLAVHRPALTELYGTIGITGTETLDDEAFFTLLSDQDAFEAQLPAGIALENLPSDFIEKLQEIALELADVMEKFAEDNADEIAAITDALADDVLGQLFG